MDPRYQPPSTAVRDVQAPSASALRALILGVMVGFAGNILFRAIFWAQVILNAADTTSLGWQLLAAVPGSSPFFLLTAASCAFGGLGGFVAGRLGGNWQVAVTAGLVVAVGGYVFRSVRYPLYPHLVAAALVFASVLIGAYLSQRQQRPN